MTARVGDLALEELSPEHQGALLALFEAADCPCYCRYYHFDGDKNEWLDRCANQPGESRRELAAAIAGRRRDAHGVVAIDRDASQLVGWLKVAPAETVPKAYDQRLYKGLPCFDGDRSGVFFIGCALIHPGWRKRGVATELVRHAVRRAPAWGARALEAFPRKPRPGAADEELWTLPLGAFKGAGFEEVHAFEPYPVLRIALGTEHGQR